MVFVKTHGKAKGVHQFISVFCMFLYGSPKPSFFLDFQGRLASVGMTITRRSAVETGRSTPFASAKISSTLKTHLLAQPAFLTVSLKAIKHV